MGPTTKTLFKTFITLGALLAVLSCQKLIPAELNVTQSELSFSKDGGSQSITFSTNKDWTASSSASWVKVTSSGTSSATSINVTVEPNPDYDDRTATLTITAEDLTKTVNIKQSTNLGFLITRNKYELTNDAQSVEIEVQANVEFEYSIDDACKGWITTSATKSLSSNKVKFDIAQNDSYDNREGKIVFKQKGGTLTETVTISQSQINGLFLTTSEYAISDSEHNITVEIKANVQFSVTSEADWIQYIETKALSTSNISLKVSKNETYDKRVGTVKVKQTNGSLEGIITITQDENLGLFVAPEEITISKDSQEVEVEVNTNVDYDIIVPEDAKGIITSVKTEGGETKALTSKRIRFGISENETYYNREASITFKQKNGDLCGTFKIIQSQKEYFELKVSSFNVGVLGGVFRMEIQHNVEIVDIAIDGAAKDWIKRIESSTEQHENNAEGIYADKIDFQVSENDTDNERIGRIAITSKSSTIEATVTQIGDGIIQFENNIVKYACVHKYDTNGDGELSKKEAAAVTSLSDLFSETGLPVEEFTFNEMKYFSSAQDIPGFRGCKLEEITIPNGISEISEMNFGFCSNLNKVVFDGTYSSLKIGDFAFRNCNSLREIYLPEGLTTLGNDVFYGCINTEFTLPSTIETIGARTFLAESLVFHSLTFPHSLREIGENAFEKVHFTGTTIFDSNKATIDNEAFKQAVFDDIVFEKNSVVNIGIRAFAEAQIQGVVFKEQNELIICNDAFRKSSLSEISFSNNSVDNIGDYAFAETHIESITLPSMTRLGMCVFSNNTFLKSIRFTDKIDDIYGGAFENCTALEYVEIPDWMTEIPNHLFSGCSSLDEVKIPNTTTKIGRAAFKFCPFYKNGASCFYLPPNIEFIGEEALNRVLNIIITQTDRILDLEKIGAPCNNQGYLDYYVPSELFEVYKNRFHGWCQRIYDIKDFPRCKYDNIPDGFVDMGLPVLWAKEDLPGKYIWPGTNLDHDNYRVTSKFDLDCLIKYCEYKNGTIISPYTHNTISFSGVHWLSDSGYGGHARLVFDPKLYNYNIGTEDELIQYPIRMVYSLY